MLRILIILCAMMVQSNILAAEPDGFAAARFAMAAEINALAKETQAETGQGIISNKVMAAIAKVPRHEFVPPDLTQHAYHNRPLPIGYGQTISQPFLVAYMTELLKVNQDSKVLEIGTGSGYQAAILGELAKEVYTIEIIKPLAERAADALKANGYANVKIQVGDGYYGWEKHAPFDAIMVTAVASHVPQPLISQLKRGGRMLIPLGSSFMPQHLVLVEKDLQDKVRTRELLPVQFVPLTGGH